MLRFVGSSLCLALVLTPAAAAAQTLDKMALWSSGSVELRGANVYQRRVYPELDGPEFMGPGPLGPPYTQADFNRLAALGANYVNVSHAGIYSEKPPYRLDAAVAKSLDRTLAKIAGADLFAVISFRTGPGRSEFTFFWEEAGDWFDETYLNDRVWLDAEAQDAWAAMWRAAAERYRGHPAVAGYDLMVEPNSNDRWADTWEPEEFYREHGGTLMDWNQLYPRIVEAIREVDAETPILVGGMSYSAAEWLPYVRLVDDERTVYTLHQYEPYVYTHQEPDDLSRTYPGTFDPWGGDEPQRIDVHYMEGLLLGVDDFVEENGVAVAANEIGVMRWEPGAERFLDDEIGLLEQRGINWALWIWDPSYEPLTEEVNAFNFRFGPDPESLTDETNALLDVIRGYWERNTLRPSSFVETEGCVADEKALCLQDERFRVTVAWEDSKGNTGDGYAAAMTADTGYFWFFHPDNVEIVVKVLDGRSVNGHFWVFYGALSNVEFRLEVTDTESGKRRTYENPQGRFASRGDTRAFPG